MCSPLLKICIICHDMVFSGLDKAASCVCVYAYMHVESGRDES